MQEVWHGQDHVAVGHAGQETSADEVGPSVGIDFGTGQAKAGLAGEGNPAGLSARQAAVLYKAHRFGVAAVQHFLDGVVVVWTVVARVDIREAIPMVFEDLLEGLLVDAFHGCPLRTTILTLMQHVQAKVEPSHARRSKSPAKPG